MLRLTVTTKRTPVEVMREARRFFGREGFGLQPSIVDNGLSFTGGGGFVTIALFDENGKTLVDLSSREFDDPVKRFAREIA